MLAYILKRILLMLPTLLGVLLLTFVVIQFVPGDAEDDGRLTVGDTLPAERELARMLDVGRAAVREAVRTLEAQGVVRSAVGAGLAEASRGAWSKPVSSDSACG